MLRVEVQRSKSSYNFRDNPNLPHSFENNWKNNSKDWFILFDDDAEICRFRCQSVANYCFGDMAQGDTVAEGDTIAEGEFTLKAFVEPRSFHGEIHAITQTVDLDGQVIDRNAMQLNASGFQNGRWLVHSRYSSKIGTDTNYAWSAGCFIVSTADLAFFAEMLHAYKVQPGELIPGQVIEH